ncbi:MAG: GTPase ObgE [Candidatus Eisenbacteria bacterium]|uniref:GTPase Obg n=1 Tax=Eiseniibacteriota bacterium TaxID=2212470 RepID=A0A849SKC9_UNCEI|nr:GTPase ObgE [Candidatus Eisenbacteria bacterium]
MRSELEPAVLIDLARIEVFAGKGGAGCISFRREKYVPKGGPNGGDGGRGGSVIFEVDAHVRTLLDVHERPRYRARGGRAGSGNNRTGRDGEDLVLRLPPGTVVKDSDSGEVLIDLLAPGDRWVAVKGGRGGRGNSRFATATHQAPRRADPGEAGEERKLELELKLIADVGLVGPPNAGKSTLLARITRARPKIADYPFTTLEPHLGIVELDLERRFVAADLPGLIEDAHRGRGLGLDFLRHIERTRVLLLMADVGAESPASDLAMIENELAQHSKTLLTKPRLTVLTKADILPAEERAGAAARVGVPGALLISAQTGYGLEELLQALWLAVAASDSELAESDETRDGPWVEGQT